MFAQLKGGRMKMAIIALSALLIGSSTMAQSNMFRVAYVATKTLGTTVLDREEGVHTFSPEGFHRIDREIDGERPTEISIPASTEGEAERIEINHTLGTARRGPARMMMFGQPLRMGSPLSDLRTTPLRREGSQSAQTERVLREGSREHYLGEEVQGPLVLHHYRVEFPGGPTRDSWRYRYAGGEITVALLIRGTMPDGTPAVQETRILSAVRTAFSTDAFTPAIPDGTRVQNLWELIGSPAPRQQR